jgi:hypothetical protein
MKAPFLGYEQITKVLLRSRLLSEIAVSEPAKISNGVDMIVGQLCAGILPRYNRGAFDFSPDTLANHMLVFPPYCV